MSDNNEALAEQLATKHYKAMCAKELGHLSTIDTIASAIREALAQAQPAAVPEGWEISFDDDKYNIGLVEKSTQGRIWICHDGNSDERMVWRLLSAILSAAPAQPSAAEESSGAGLLDALTSELQSAYDTDGHEGPEGDAAIRLCDAIGAVEEVLTGNTHGRDAIAWTAETGYVFADKPAAIKESSGADHFPDATKMMPAEAGSRMHWLETLLAYARDDVATELDRLKGYAGYPKYDQQIAEQEKLLLRIDDALATRIGSAPAQPAEAGAGADVGFTTMKPTDPVEVTRAQGNAYFASMKMLGLAPHEYLPDAIRKLQANYEAAVKGRQDFRDALRETRLADARQGAVAYACPFHAGEAIINGAPYMLIPATTANDEAKRRGLALYLRPTSQAALSGSKGVDAS